MNKGRLQSSIVIRKETLRSLLGEEKLRLIGGLYILLTKNSLSILPPDRQYLSVLC